MSNYLAYYVTSLKLGRNKLPRTQLTVYEYYARNNIHAASTAQDYLPKLPKDTTLEKILKIEEIVYPKPSKPRY